jgi:hypothetical protein
VTRLAPLTVVNEESAAEKLTDGERSGTVLMLLFGNTTYSP